MTATALSAPRARPGRRQASVLTAARVKQICVLVERGVPQAAAAGSVGIPRRTYQEWLAKGRLPDSVEPYASLAEKVEEALDKFHASRAVIVGESMEDRTALEVLRRRFKDDWADPERGGSPVNVTVTIAAERSAAADEMLAAALRALEGDPERLEVFLGELGGGRVVDGEAVEVAEIEA